MTDNSHPPKVDTYRSKIYDQYVSVQVSPANRMIAEDDYKRWSEGTQKRLEGWLPADQGIPILDMGCGPGNFLYLMQLLGYTNLTGVDLSLEQIGLAQKWCPKAQIYQGDVRLFLMQRPEHFGLIAGFDIIEHFKKEEIIPLFETIYQALSSRGTLILQTPNAESPWMGSVGYSDFTHEWFFSPIGLENILRMAGFENIQMRECGPYPHGIKSLVRTFLWRCIRIGLGVWNLAETGGLGSGIYTRVFIASAQKGS